MLESSQFDCSLYKSQDPSCCLIEQEAKLKKLEERTLQVGLNNPSKIIVLPMYQVMDTYINDSVRFVSTVAEHPVLAETLANSKLSIIGRRKIYGVHATMVYTKFKNDCPLLDPK